VNHGTERCISFGGLRADHAVGTEVLRVSWVSVTKADGTVLAPRPLTGQGHGAAQSQLSRATMCKTGAARRCVSASGGLASRRALMHENAAADPRGSSVGVQLNG
jgi:hypothetical protein